MAAHFLPLDSLILGTWADAYVAGLADTRYVGEPMSEVAHTGISRWVALFAETGLNLGSPVFKSTLGCRRRPDQRRDCVRREPVVGRLFHVAKLDPEAGSGRLGGSGSAFAEKRNATRQVKWWSERGPLCGPKNKKRGRGRVPTQPRPRNRTSGNSARSIARIRNKEVIGKLARQSPGVHRLSSVCPAHKAGPLTAGSPRTFNRRCGRCRLAGLPGRFALVRNASWSSSLHRGPVRRTVWWCRWSGLPA